MKPYIKVILLILLAIPTAMSGQEPSSYDEFWNMPTISHATTGYHYQYFGGLAAPYDRHPTVNISSLPPVPGMKYRSCYYVCPADSCNADRAVFALRCPDKPSLLRWVSSRAEWFVEWCESDDFEHESTPPGKAFTTCSELLDHYMNKIVRSFHNQQCEHTGPDANRQYALLFTDCWSIGTEYTTFYEASWFDHFSAGNNICESYYTVNNQTGKTIELKDLVIEKKMPELAELMLNYLKDSFDVLWTENNKTNDPLAILEAMDGFGLVREGLVISFHPYKIASGVEGEITAVIPQEKLNGFLKAGFEKCYAQAEPRSYK